SAAVAISPRSYASLPLARRLKSKYWCSAICLNSRSAGVCTVSGNGICSPGQGGVTRGCSTSRRLAPAATLAIETSPRTTQESNFVRMRYFLLPGEDGRRCKYIVGYGGSPLQLVIEQVFGLECQHRPKIQPQPGSDA